ncbi:MAG: hypothetical protein ACE5LU_07265 [Anaerolineae bacterium]
MVGSYRPEDVALGRAGERHPLESVVNELKRCFGDVWVDLVGRRGPRAGSLWMPDWTRPRRCSKSYRYDR